MNDAVLKLYVKMQRLQVASIGTGSGQDLIKYALAAALVALAAAALVAIVGTNSVATAICTTFTSVGAGIGHYTS